MQRFQSLFVVSSFNRVPTRHSNFITFEKISDAVLSNVIFDAILSTIIFDAELSNVIFDAVLSVMFDAVLSNVIFDAVSGRGFIMYPASPGLVPGIFYVLRRKLIGLYQKKNFVCQTILTPSCFFKPG